MGCVHGKCFRRRRRRAGAGAGAATLSTAVVPSAGLVLEFATLTLAGHYPDSPTRENQDSLLVCTRFAGDPDLHLFAVFDGHGASGAACSSFAAASLPSLLAADSRLLVASPAAAFRAALLATNSALHDSPDIDDSMSGTTAVAVLVSGGRLHVANVGDSRAVAAVLVGDRVVADELSWDQTPMRDDERARVRACGARVMSVEQVEGVRDAEAEGWGEGDGDPPRVWARDGLYPGTAFTRSIGDAAAEAVGVIAEPEVKSVAITPAHLFFVVASDGVFEFLSSQAVIDMVSVFQDPRDACSAIAAESYKLWLEHENRTDDITIIVVHIKGSCNSGPVLRTDQLTRSSTKSSIALDAIRADRFVLRPLEAGDPSGGGATDLQSYSSDSPTERSLSCVAPSPTQPLFLDSKGLEVSEREEAERVVWRVPDAHHPREVGATQVHLCSSGSPMEQSVSCVAPPSHTVH